MTVRTGFRRLAGYSRILEKESVIKNVVGAKCVRNASTSTFRAVVCVDPAKPLEIQDVKRKTLTDAQVR
jgi:hypothetical protein